MSSGSRRPPPIGPRVLVNHHPDSGGSSRETSKRDGAARDDGHRNTDRDNRHTSSSSYSSSKDREHGYRPRHYPDALVAANSSHDYSRSTTHDTRSSAPNAPALLRHNQREFLRASSHFSANFSDTFFHMPALSRHHTTNPTRTITNSRVATSRRGTQEEKLVRDIRPGTRSKTVKGQGCHLPIRRQGSLWRAGNRRAGPPTGPQSAGKGPLCARCAQVPPTAVPSHL